MIENDRQLVVTKVQAANFTAAIAEARSQGPLPQTDPLIHAAYIVGMESQLETLKREITEYTDKRRKPDDIS